MASHSDKQANVPPRCLEPPPFRGFFLTRGPSGPIPSGCVQVETESPLGTTARSVGVASERR